VKAQSRRISRNVEVPETLLTVEDTCFSWNRTQICTEPSLLQVLTGEEQQVVAGSARNAVAQLAQRNILTANEASSINVAGAIVDAEGRAAVQQQRASIVAAPAASFPAAGQEVVHNALLGVVDAELDVEVPGFPTLPRGVYAVRALQRDQEWRGLFIGADGRRFEIPAQLVEVRGEMDTPMAIVINLRIGLCFWEC
jgi:hypothetical protein